MKTYFAIAIAGGMVLAAIAALPSPSHAMDLGLGVHTDAAIDLKAEKNGSTASATADGSVKVQTGSDKRDDSSSSDSSRNDNNGKNDGFFGRIWTALNLNKGTGNENIDDSSKDRNSDNNGVNATATADAEITVEGAPDLFFLRVTSVTDDSVKVKWMSSERASAKVWTELDGDINTSVIPSGSQDSLSFFHNIKVENLEAGTTYHFKVASTDREGNTTVSTLGTFTTKVE